jgi:hypothetical protein
MTQAKQPPKRKRRSKAVPVLGAAAGLSLSLAGAASASVSGPGAGVPPNPAVGHEVMLCEVEVSDVSLATFYVRDKESDGVARPRMRLAGMACGGCGCAGGGACWSGNYLTPLFGGCTYYPLQPPVRTVRPYAPAVRRVPPR